LSISEELVLFLLVPVFLVGKKSQLVGKNFGTVPAGFRRRVKSPSFV
jgi:hypothetical protein